MTDFERAVFLAVERLCGKAYGYATGGIANAVGRQPGHDSDRAHSQCVRHALRSLEKQRLVARMDDQLPVIWVRA